MNEQSISDEQRELIPSVPNQTTIWDAIRYADDGPDAPNPFRRDPEEEAKRRKLAQHKLWLESIAFATAAHLVPNAVSVSPACVHAERNRARCSVVASISVSV